MSDIKISIYGSCVSRDAFSFLDRDSMINHYLARSSLISQMSQPIKEELIPDLSCIDSNFQRRMVLKDFIKDGPPYKDDMILLMDFIDERYQLLNFEDSYVTESFEFGNVVRKHSLKLNYPFIRGDKEDRKEWTKACLKFNTIKKKYNLSIILHGAFFASLYQIKDSGTCHFENKSYIDGMNKKLNFYYDEFIEICAPEMIIKIPDNLRIADEDHKWGLAPFHYQLPYYEYFLQKIDSF